VSTLPPALVKWMRFTDYLSTELFGGPKVVKLAWVVNFQKGGTLFFVLFLMAWFDVWTPTAWTYAAMHGSYGLCWLLKDRVFPDPNFERRITLGGALSTWVLVLGLYWLAPVLVVVGRVELPFPVLCFATVAYVLGVVLMMGSDAQKYFTLRARKGLITDGFFARIRHPNYLGEMVLYGSFAVLANHWAPWLVLAWVWLGVFVPNMLRKEASMARYPEWAAYQARTFMLLPKPWALAPQEPTDLQSHSR
jgi:protein-S-isoprenylcysteine O-methyltransferase Ste14